MLKNQPDTAESAFRENNPRKGLAFLFQVWKLAKRDSVYKRQPPNHTCSLFSRACADSDHHILDAGTLPGHVWSGQGQILCISVRAWSISMSIDMPL